MANVRDLTSALEMWGRLAESGFTMLAASNQPVAIARADRVIDLP
ncbi:MAG: hypothetical protein WD023_01385 [Ilumatobacteraceae bacterium]